MSLRDAINQSRRKSGVIIVAGFVCFVVGCFGASVSRVFVVLCLAGFAAAFITMIYQLYGTRCPRCGGKIGLALNSFGNLFAVPSQFRYCPFCGVALDAQFEGTQQT